jgi:hypothetical protein
VSKLKLHLVMKGYAQLHNSDSDKVFTLVDQLDSMHLLNALVVHDGYDVHHMDVKLVFLNDDLQEEVYIELQGGLHHHWQGAQCA